jgi:hypothetical protein
MLDEIRSLCGCHYRAETRIESAADGVRRVVAERDALRAERDVLIDTLRIRGEVHHNVHATLAGHPGEPLLDVAKRVARLAFHDHGRKVHPDALIVLAQRVGMSWYTTQGESLLKWSEETGGPMIAKALGLEVA